MKTLYELLGALPDDDAEALRSAFRRAVKGAHPDLRPGDPDAALKFRQIIRANEILTDAEERDTYDHLLELARVEQASASKRAVATRIHKVASCIIALTGASVASVGGYFLFIHISAASIAPTSDVNSRLREWAEMADTELVGSSDFQNRARFEIGETIFSEPLAPPITIGAAIISGSAAPADLGPAREIVATEARALRVRGLSAYRKGDLNAAIADLDQALQLDPKFLPAYIDRGIIVYRQHKFDRTFADLARGRPNGKVPRSGSAARTIRKQQHAGIGHFMRPVAQRQPIAQDPSHGDGVLSAMR